MIFVSLACGEIKSTQALRRSGDTTFPLAKALRVGLGPKRQEVFSQLPGVTAHRNSAEIPVATVGSLQRPRITLVRTGSRQERARYSMRRAFGMCDGVLEEPLARLATAEVTVKKNIPNQGISAPRRLRNGTRW
ncbi:MAG: hypothetical protein AVDCRST_MAG28-3757 [uncultured Rubrobacteraceae bacterium]|uniref:Uncharacterized protein n=1 Tax=uncultured Rubrobacteraceae bacterium TaxID=349277 RepID=A0A6J4R6I5_9ACTN|nr:MAG: hypothetical protein AVDCRST_MAG28-3757 [uncultured Rubrobacteraceae bacterium]